MTDTKKPPKTETQTPERTESRVVLPVDPSRRTEIDKQRVPMSARPYRLLALVKQDAVVRVQKEPDDTVMTWPHLLSIEFLAAGVMSVFLLLMGLFINAPLEELANGNVTPAVAKAPWYFLGLQELLAYFHPVVAGVLVPTFLFVGLIALPYMDRGDLLATRPSLRKTAVALGTLFAILGLTITFIGIFFRGPGYSFVIPYLPFFQNSTNGFHFAL
jgi:menaquinol-cytochrome c reductase cytochrome b/c subunit